MGDPQKGGGEAGLTLQMRSLPETFSEASGRPSKEQEGSAWFLPRSWARRTEKIFLPVVKQGPLLVLEFRIGFVPDFLDLPSELMISANSFGPFPSTPGTSPKRLR